jgi:hypothetical protein
MPKFFGFFSKRGFVTFFEDFLLLAPGAAAGFFPVFFAGAC